MSRFFDGLRARLSQHFVLREAPASAPDDTRAVTIAAWLPDEISTIEMVSRIQAVRRMANGRAIRLESRADLKRSGGLRWRVEMTFYLGPGAAERAALEGRIADLALALGGGIAAEPPAQRRPVRQRAA
jgi:hypothetical protein